jgi:hypothetical protein
MPIWVGGGDRLRRRSLPARRLAYLNSLSEVPQVSFGAHIASQICYPMPTGARMRSR